MLAITLLIVSQIPFAICQGDKICLRANEFAGKYAAWTRIVNAGKPGTVDAREPAAWKQAETAFKRLRNSREWPSLTK